MDKRLPVAIVTGGSGGIGRCIASQLAELGFKVYELSRSGISYAGVTHVSADVSVLDSAAHGVKYVMELERHLDLVVCNAGFGISGAVEFTSPDDAKRLMEVNFFGVVNAVHAALPYLRQTGGRIVCTSSVAGVLSIPFQTYYSVSKAAINAFVAGLYNELRPIGVSVTAVMPGDVHTGFTKSRVKLHEGDNVYSGRISRSVAAMEKDEQNGMTPDSVARFICRIAVKKHVKPIYTAGLKYRLFTFLAKLLPCQLVSWILYRLYAAEK